MKTHAISTNSRDLADEKCFIKGKVSRPLDFAVCYEAEEGNSQPSEKGTDNSSNIASGAVNSSAASSSAEIK